ncbi:MAG TPA: DNA ligase D [Myxococcota bacterium]|nr:DNA ligase D [Myxococcota bacterium]
MWPDASASVDRGTRLNDRRNDRGLSRYRHMRHAGATPEPFGAGGVRPGLFVVQQHAARRMHYDLRLEWRGALLSWAVPKGPSLDPSEKRMAVQVEDHPVEYADFEGVIPEGNYGAGEVILWDRGRWIPREDPDAGLASGKLLFDLEGFKLRGRFTLVRTARGGAQGREWLLIKKEDAHASRDPTPHGDMSVLSGRTLAELRDGAPRLSELAREIERSGARAGRVDAAALRPMLAERAAAAFSAPGWLFEVKYDGYRMIASAGAGAALYTRSGRAAAARFPEVVQALAALPVPHAVLDGELVAFDAEGRPSFQRLQQRAQLARPEEIARAQVEIAVGFQVFDLLGFGERDLRDLPLARRKEFLSRLVPPVGVLLAAPHFEERGEEVYAQVQALGLEGIVAKRADSPYRSGRTPLWKKVRSLATADLVVVGFTVPAGSRTGFGALHLARAEAGGLVYTGRVGSGFSDHDLLTLRADLDALTCDTPACRGAPPATRADRWVEPRLVCEVRYTEVTGDGLLRQPVFLRLRDDKTPDECRLEEAEPRAEAEAEPETAPAAQVAAPASRKEVPFTNREKVFWPDDGLTKGDLLDYYRDIAPWLLAYLADRPLVMTRFPDGIAGKSFFQKDAPAWAPPWVRTERMWSEEGERELRYFVCEDVESLLYVINLGTIPLHVWSSRISKLQHPDWCILDLDPKGAPFAHVVEVARALHALCEELALPSFVKTSGSTGLHVLVPLGAQLTHAQSRALAELLAQAVVARVPEIATVARSLRRRDGKVYVDALQNGHGKLLVAPFSARPVPGARVSMPLRWRDVTARLDPAQFHLRNAPARMRRLGGDPLAPVLRESPDLLVALERLARQMPGTGA